jgi:hypothetical protein
MREAAQSGGNDVGKVSDADMGIGFLFVACQWLVTGLRRPRPIIAEWRQ